MPDIFADDYGTIFEVTVLENNAAINLTAATLVQFIFTSPGRPTVVKTASFSTDGADGKVRITTAQGDISAAGVWYLQVKITFAGSQFRTEVAQFNVVGVST